MCRKSRDRKAPVGKRGQGITTAFFIVAFCCAAMMPGQVREAAGDELKLLPSIAVKEEYNDNILLTPVAVTRDFITTLVPGLTFIDRTERMDVNVAGRLEQRSYARYTDLNATDQYYEGTGKYMLTPTLNLSGRAFYSDDSRPGRDIYTTGLPLLAVTRWRQNYTVSGDYSMSEKTLATLSYDYLNDAYNSNAYVDLEAHTMNLAFTHDLSSFGGATKGLMNLGYTRYNMSGLTKVDNYEATVGISRDLNEKWSFLINGGARQTDSKFQAAQLITPRTFAITEESTQGWGTVGRTNLSYKGENGTGGITISEDLFPPSGQSGTLERISVLFDANRRFTYELYGIFFAGYYSNKTSSGQSGIQGVDAEALVIRPGIRYEWNRNMSLETTYSYTRVKNNITGTIAERDVIEVRFRLQHDLLN